MKKQESPGFGRGEEVNLDSLFDRAAHVAADTAAIIRTLKNMPIHIKALEETMSEQTSRLTAAVDHQMQQTADLAAQVQALTEQVQSGGVDAAALAAARAEVQRLNDAIDAQAARLESDDTPAQPEQPVEPETPVEQPAPADGQPVEQDETGTVTEPTA